MKRFYKIAIIGLVSSITILSCKKYEALDYAVDKPLTIANQEQIDAYNPLKSYLDSVKYPKFKLGAAISLSEYVSKGVMYRLVNSNFNDITAGYEMKHGSIVRQDGSLNLTNVNTLLQTASKAKISVFGHALVWHSGQNAAYLNRLIAPIIIPGVSQPTWDLVTGANFESDNASNYEFNANAIAAFTAAGQGAGGTGRALKITNTSVRTNDYDVQLFVKLPNAVVIGEKYELVLDVKADNAASYSTQAHIAPGAYKHWDFFGTISATTAWTKYTKQITITADIATSRTIAFNLGKTATSFYFDNITVKKYNEKGSGNAGYSYFFTNPTAANFWTAQVVHGLSPALQNGKEYTIKFAAKGSVAGNIRSELQSTSDYSNNAFGTIALTTAWKEYEFKTTTSKADRNNFVISFGDYVGKVNIDNVKLTLTDGTANLIPTVDFESGIGAWGGYGNGSTRGLSAQGEGYGGAQDQFIEKTAAQKKILIANAMKSWISVMVDTTKKYVKAWDVVNEPMDDARPYELKTGVGKTLAADQFFWQDYLGKDYAVDAFKLARQYGSTTDVHFINDYNLEYSIDKCKGLIQYVQYIESKGAKVDGIGTQMHISTTADKAKIEEMFKLLASTGKLIKVSELDMGISGKKTPDATQDDYNKQMELYKFVIDKYFEIIPANQRYGITIWSPLDSPVNSFWRAGEPIGLWTQGFIRKPSFMGVADGFKGK